MLTEVSFTDRKLKEFSGKIKKINLCLEGKKEIIFGMFLLYLYKIFTQSSTVAKQI